MTSSGYDTPIETADEDMLHRLGFAREIVDLATSAPKRWAIRIGLYGPWGTGKSSVLNLCRSLIEARGHIAADFSPWGYGNSKEMLRGLAGAAIEALATKELTVDGGARRKLRGAADSVGRVATAAIGAAESLPTLEVGAKVASHGARLVGPWLSRLLDNDDAADFAAIDRALGTKRLVVLIDDVDRADPGVLPQLLFALHEVMAQPGITYVVALDPVVVSGALANHHPGFGDGIAFLEKVIQFPRWIPEPSQVDLAALAQREASEFAPFIPPHVIQENLELLPLNPRGLRSVLRNLWTIGKQATRHDEDEFDPHLLLRVHLLRSEFPRLFREVVMNTDEIRALLWSTARNKEDDDASRQTRILEIAKQWAPGRHERAAQLLRALLNNSMLWNTERLEYYARMAESPPAVTWKEFRTFMSAFVDRPCVDTIERWFTAHATNRETTAQVVAEETFATAARYHYLQMECAADSNCEQAQQDPIRYASSAIELLDKLLFESGQCPLTGETFKVVLGAVRSWAHFESSVYHDIRARERALIMKCINESNEPQTLLEILAPWMPSSYFDERQRTLTGSLIQALVPRIAASLEDVFVRSSGVRAVIESELVANRWVLFHPARFWNSERAKAVATAVGATPTPIVAENCAQFLQKLADDRMENGRWGFDRGAADEILREHELVDALWRYCSCKLDGHAARRRGDPTHTQSS